MGEQHLDNGLAAKQMAEKVLEVMDDKIERNVKDSVFCDLFKDPNKVLELYRSLFPEDKTTTVDDLTLITLSRVIVRTMFNDLGFIVGNRLIVLFEAQSTWTENILVRYLEYIAETYRRYIHQNEMNVYSSTKVKLPIPELYVLYTGDRITKPDKITLKESFFGGQGSVDVEAKMVYDGKHGDILSQFVRFTKVFDEQRKIHDDPRKAVEETIKICREENVLKDYLEREEAAVVMFTFADQERATKLTMEEERREGENKLGNLITKLLADGKTEAVGKVAIDEKYRQEMYKAYGMA